MYAPAFFNLCQTVKGQGCNLDMFLSFFILFSSSSELVSSLDLRQIYIFLWTPADNLHSSFLLFSISDCECEPDAVKRVITPLVKWPLAGKCNWNAINIAWRLCIFMFSNANSLWYMISCWEGAFFCTFWSIAAEMFDENSKWKINKDCAIFTLAWVIFWLWWDVQWENKCLALIMVEKFGKKVVKYHLWWIFQYCPSPSSVFTFLPTFITPPPSVSVSSPLLTLPSYLLSFVLCSRNRSEKAVVRDGAMFGGRGLWPVSQ